MDTNCMHSGCQLFQWNTFLQFKKYNHLVIVYIIITLILSHNNQIYVKTTCTYSPFYEHLAQKLQVSEHQLLKGLLAQIPMWHQNVLL